MTFYRGYSRELEVYTLDTNSHIFFSIPDENDSEKLSRYLNSSNHSKIIYLLNPSYNFNVFQYMDRTFSIKTRTNSYIFNVDLLLDTSDIVKGILSENPQNLQYKLNSKIDESAMAKIEQLYQGQIIKLALNEQHSFRLILDELGIQSHFTPIHSNRNWPDPLPKKKRNAFQMVPNNFYSYLNGTYPKTFTIATKNKEYQCNKIGVNSSKLLRELLSKNPNLNRYEYDFEDDCNEFQSICDFFNFNMVTLTIDNMNSMKSIAEDLQIDIIINDVDACIEDYEKRVQTLDDQQNMIDSIDELFDILYNIKQITVESVKHKIVESSWSQTEENVRELIAFICQVVSTDFLLHPYLADLIVSLDKEADDTNELKNIVPFIVYEVMRYFATSITNSSFVYHLYKRGLISEEKIKDELNKSYKIIISDHSSNSSSYSLYNRKNFNPFKGLIFFIPELLELSNSDLSRISSVFDKISLKFIYSYVPKNIENFKKMRDLGEPDDQITKALRYDDIDTFQAIVSKSQIDIQKSIVPFNLFEKFVPNGETNYINYAAAYGSVKCFKYLLLNHAPLNDSSFSFAVYGGNTEIVKIIDQKMSDPNTVKEKPKSRRVYGYGAYAYGKSESNNDSIEKFAPAIQKHRNDLFDWIIEQKYTNIIQDKSLVEKILNESSENGNSHSIATIVDKGFDLSILNNDTIFNLIRNASSKGFYKLLVFITNIMKKKLDQIKSSKQKLNIFNLNYSVIFGNLSIYKFSYEQMKTNENVNESLYYAVEHNYKSIVEYIFDNILVENKECNVDYYKLLSNSITQESTDLFNYLIDKMIKIEPNPLIKDNNKNIKLLSEACYLNKFEISKKITDLIFELIKDVDIDLSLPFFNAAVAGSSGLCQYFIDKKAAIDLNKILLHVKELASIKKDVLDIIVKNINPKTKEILISCYIKEVISVKNKSFIEYLLNENAFYTDILFDAIKTCDIEIVNMILNRKSDPSFINQISKNGTALNLAVKMNNIEIVKRLLSIPGIDPSLYEENNRTPLITAVENLNILMMNAILDFYGPEIKKQSWQLDVAVKKFLNKISIQKEQNERLEQISKYESETEQPKKKEVKRAWDSNYSVNKKSSSPKWSKKGEKQSLSDLLRDDSLHIAVFKRLLEIDGIDLNCHANNYTLFSYACEANIIDIVEIMLKNPKVDVNSYAQSNGNTPLMIAINKQNIEIIKLLIDCDRTDINMRNIDKKTALLMAVEIDFVDAVDLIINNKKFDPFESCLNYAFYISKGKSSEKLIKYKNLDVNYKVSCPQEDDSINIDELRRVNDLYYHKKQYYENYYGIHYVREIHDKNSFSKLNFRISSELKLFSTPLINAVKNLDLSKVDLIINHPEFDNEKSLIKEAILIACYNNKVKFFKKLIKLVGNDLNSIKENDNNLFDIAINAGSHLIVSEILNNKDFDLKKYNIVEIFASCFRRGEQPSFDVMKAILSFDKEHEKLIDFKNILHDGKSFFTCIRRGYNNIRELIRFLIHNGANPNLPDSTGCYPLEYALSISWNEYACTLIEIGNLDFNMKFKPKYTNSFPDFIKSAEMTYLHLSVLYDCNDVFHSIVYRNHVNVNITDSNGETPLMYACRCRDTSIISTLFEIRNLDYFKKNKDGDDALKIVLKMANVKILKRYPRKKHDYHDHLIRFLTNDWDPSEIFDDSKIDDENDKKQKFSKFSASDYNNLLGKTYVAKHNPYYSVWLENDDKAKLKGNNESGKDSNKEVKTDDKAEESNKSTNKELTKDDKAEKSSKSTNKELKPVLYNHWLEATHSSKWKSTNNAFLANVELNSDSNSEKSATLTNNELKTDDKTEKSVTSPYNNWPGAAITSKYRSKYNELLTSSSKTASSAWINNDSRADENSEKSNKQAYHKWPTPAYKTTKHEESVNNELKCISNSEKPATSTIKTEKSNAPAKNNWPKTSSTPKTSSSYNKWMPSANKTSSNTPTNNELKADDNSEKSNTSISNKFLTTSNTPKYFSSYNKWIGSANKTSSNIPTNNELKADDNSEKSNTSISNKWSTISNTPKTSLSYNKWIGSANKTSSNIPTNNELKADDNSEKSNTSISNKWSTTSNTPKTNSVYNKWMASSDTTTSNTTVNNASFYSKCEFAKNSTSFSKFGQSYATDPWIGFQNSDESTNKNHLCEDDTLNTSSIQLHESNNKKSSFITHKFSQFPETKTFHSSKIENESQETSSNDDRLIQDEFAAVLTGSLENLAPDLAQQISKSLCSIAEKRMKKMSEFLMKQNQSKEEDTENKEETTLNLRKHVNDKEKNEKNEKIRKISRSSNHRNRRKLKIEDNDFDDMITSYQDQVFQQQWNQMMQLDSMRNIQFGVVMQQQQMMMKSFGTEIRKNESSAKNQPKKKKKSSK